MPRPHHHILVCTNERPAESPKGCCKAKGSQEIYMKLREAIFARGLRSQVYVCHTSCLKSCAHGPTVAVWPEGAFYGGMTPDRIDRLLDSVVAGEVVEEWRVPEGEIGK